MKNLHVNLNKLFIYFSGLFICPVYADISTYEKTNEVISSVQLLGCNPLKNLKSFAIHPQYSILSPGLRSKVNEVISEELKKIGRVINLQTPDVRGYGNSQANITMMFNAISSSKGMKIPVFQTILTVSSATTIEKTKTKCSTYIWSSQLFSEGNIEETNAANILDSLKTVITKFVGEYQDINKDSKEKPSFYLYNL